MYEDEEIVVAILLWIWFALMVFVFAVVLGSASDEPSRAVVQCVDERMQTLEGTSGMWSNEQERAEMAEALEDFCKDVQK